MSTALNTRQPDRYELALNLTDRVDAEREGVRAEIEQTFAALPNSSIGDIRRPFLPFTDLSTGQERRQSFADVFDDLMTDNRVAGALQALLVCRDEDMVQRRKFLMGVMAAAYADDYAADVGTARAGSWA
jgi:hypothetical protein